MAWRVVASSNQDMCDRLKRLEVIKEEDIYKAFTLVDRGLFAFGVGHTEDRSEAYMDRPFRLRNVHLSAPHMYSTVIEALQLSRSSNLSFLNIGSGSGYLTCLVACLIGRGGLCHGIERNEEVTEQAILTTHQWWHVMMKDDCNPFHLPHIRNISYATGNACLLAPPTSTTGMRYDRIYIGAGCSEHVWQFFRKHFLNPNNGIMVLPNDDNNNLIAIHATGTAVGNDDFSYKVVSLSSVCFNPLMDVEVLDARERLKPISFSSGLSWSTDTHRWFPTHFRVCVERVFLCGRMKGPDPLPREVLFYILSFVRRDWIVSTIHSRPIILVPGTQMQAENRYMSTFTGRLFQLLHALRWSNPSPAVVSHPGADDTLYPSVGGSELRGRRSAASVAPAIPHSHAGADSDDDDMIQSRSASFMRDESATAAPPVVKRRRVLHRSSWYRVFRAICRSTPVRERSTSGTSTTSTSTSSSVTATDLQHQVSNMDYNMDEEPHE